MAISDRQVGQMRIKDEKRPTEPPPNERSEGWHLEARNESHELERLFCGPLWDILSLQWVNIREMQADWSLADYG